MKNFFFLILFISPSFIMAQETILQIEFADTVQSTIIKPKKSINAQYIPPFTMLGIGYLSKYHQGLQQINLGIRDKVISKESRWINMKIDDALQFTPAYAVFALNAVGIKGENKFIDRVFLYAFSHYIGKTVTDNLKGLTGRLRPDGSDRRSFPSGHTTTAFAAAEFMRQEYKNASPIYAISAYAIAGATGALRIYHNKHWFTDVVAGAGIGILSADLAYLVYPKIKNFATNKIHLKPSHFKINPHYQNKTIGLSIRYKPD